VDGAQWRGNVVPDRSRHLRAVVAGIRRYHTTRGNGPGGHQDETN
jgi:hypothetical protein